MTRTALLFAPVLFGCETKPTADDPIHPGPEEAERRAEAVKQLAAENAAKDAERKAKVDLEVCINRAAWAHDEHIKINGGKLRKGMWTTTPLVLSQADHLERTS